MAKKPSRAASARRTALTVWLAAACLFAFVAIANWMGYRINGTSSVPVGIWRVIPLAGGIGRGQIVSICPPPNAVFLEAQARGYLSKGRCPGGLEPMLKPVAGVAGDVIEQTPAGLVLNGQLLPNTLALATDGDGRPLTRSREARLVVKDNEAYLISTATGRSFDSRYFGPLPLTAIEGLAVPVWVIAGHR